MLIIKSVATVPVFKKNNYLPLGHRLATNGEDPNLSRNTMYIGKKFKLFWFITYKLYSVQLQQL